MILACIKECHRGEKFSQFSYFLSGFIQNFSNLVEPITDCLKNNGSFLQIEATNEAFALIKDKLTNALVLAFSYFKKVFGLKCNARGVEIEAILSQEKRPIAFLSAKLNEARQKLSTYEQELYVIYRSLKIWESYLIANDFVLYSDYQSLQHFKSQKHINKIHARWASYFEQFNFMIRHKSGVDNKVPDALSQRILVTFQSEITGFDFFKKLYER